MEYSLLFVCVLTALAVCATAAEGVPPASAPSSIDDALERVDALFDDYYAWFGSLYDRHSGGVYYSHVARAQPHAYPPHIEPTSKYCRVIEWSDLVDLTPPEVKHAIVLRFIRPRQMGWP